MAPTLPSLALLLTPASSWRYHPGVSRPASTPDALGASLGIATPITCLFLDIGGVLLTNGWDHVARRRAAEAFHLDAEEMEERHRSCVQAYEAGHLTLDAYLDRVIFHRQRLFTRGEFKVFMGGQSAPLPFMISFMRALKARHGLRVGALSNEGRELTLHRVRTFHLADWMDFFVCSCFVQLRKPDARMYRLAVDLAQVPARQALYVDDRKPYVQAAHALGLPALHHTDYPSTRAQLARLGLTCED